jgi:hypothetical protein
MKPVGHHSCHPRPTQILTGLGIAFVVFAAGCNGGGGPQFTREDQFGRTYYIDGAGNWGFGVAEVRQGLRRAGYKGNIIVYGWSPFFNPALDQTAGRPFARGKGEALGREITAYLNRFPENQVNIMALSAGTGVAVWACENVSPPAQVSNLILLGSSLSSRYDMRKALPNIAGKVYVFHSQSDAILQGPVRTLGTIDGEFGVDSAGLVGLRPPGGGGGKIANVRWSPKFERYGWTGSHTDATSEPFVRLVLARYIVPTATASDGEPTPTGGARGRIGGG